MCGKVQPYLPSRRWIDGSFSQDLPAKRLARLYSVNHFIVSQVMPGLARTNLACGPGIGKITSMPRWPQPRKLCGLPGLCPSAA